MCIRDSHQTGNSSAPPSVSGCSRLHGRLPNHQALFAQLEEIKTICVEENHLPLDRAEALLMALQEHFNTEERLAFAVGHDFAEHALKHEKMMAVIRNGIAKVNAGTKDVFGLLRLSLIHI